MELDGKYFLFPEASRTSQSKGRIIGLWINSVWICIDVYFLCWKMRFQWYLNDLLIHTDFSGYSVKLFWITLQHQQREVVFLLLTTYLSVYCLTEEAGFTSLLCLPGLNTRLLIKQLKYLIILWTRLLLVPLMFYFIEIVNIAS